MITLDLEKFKLPVKENLLEELQTSKTILFLPTNVGSYPLSLLMKAIRQKIIGFLVTPSHSMKAYHFLLEHCSWGIDNECYLQQANFSFPNFLRSLEKMEHYAQKNLKFVVCPDVVGNHHATARQWEKYSGVLKKMGYPLAYVGQDGLTALPDEDFDCFFIGGTNQFKTNPHTLQLCQEARLKGKWVHVGRVNTLSRLRYFSSVANSVDGTSWAIAPAKNLPPFLRELEKLSYADLLTEILSELRDIREILEDAHHV